MKNIDIFLVNSDNPQAESLSKKLANRVHDGAIIPLTSCEMDLYFSDDFQHIRYGETENNITKVEPGGRYIFIADEAVNIDDIMELEKRLSIKVAVVRKRG